MIDSTGNPGIPPPVTLDVVVVIAVLVVDVTETKVEIEVEIAVVAADTVDITVDVEVMMVVTRPPNGANLSIVDSAFVEIDVKPGLDPTIHPLLGAVMYTELSTGGTCPRSAGDVVI